MSSVATFLAVFAKFNILNTNTVIGLSIFAYSVFGCDLVYVNVCMLLSCFLCL